MTLEEKLADAARTYWRQTYPKEVVAFFSVKYGSKKEKSREVMSPVSDSDYEHVEFLWGQPSGDELASPIRILDLNDVLECFQETCLDNFE